MKGELQNMNHQEQREIGDTGYIIQQSFRINGKEIILAENLKAEDGQIYMLCTYESNGILGMYSAGMIGSDYLEMVEEFTKRINDESLLVQKEKTSTNSPDKLFAAEDCDPHSYAESIVNKVVVINAAVFSPEYRYGGNQLFFVTSGSGAVSNPRGRAIYGYHLNDNKRKVTRFERYDVLGIMQLESVPNWAKENLPQLQKKAETASESKSHIGDYEIIQQIETGNMVFALGKNCIAPRSNMLEKYQSDPYGTWQCYKDGRGFDHGHYFSSLEKAENDLQARAGREQNYLDRKKRNDKER